MRPEIHPGAPFGRSGLTLNDGLPPDLAVRGYPWLVRLGHGGSQPHARPGTHRKTDDDEWRHPSVSSPVPPCDEGNGRGGVVTGMGLPYIPSRMTSSSQRTPVSASSITVSCRFFGRYAEVLGVGQLELQLPAEATAGDAVAALRTRHDAQSLLPQRPLVAVNQEHVALDAPLHDGDELALLPPLAGG